MANVNLVLGLFALTVATVTLVWRFLLPIPEKSSADPYSYITRKSWFPVFAFALIPALAGTAFLGAWWQETQPQQDRSPMAQADIPPGAMGTIVPKAN